VTSSLPALQFAICRAHQQCVSDFLNFWILFECKEKGEEHFLRQEEAVEARKGQRDSFIWCHHKAVELRPEVS